MELKQALVGAWVAIVDGDDDEAAVRAAADALESGLKQLVGAEDRSRLEGLIRYTTLPGSLDAAAKRRALTTRIYEAHPIFLRFPHPSAWPNG